MVDTNITLELGENNIKIVKARNVGGRVEFELIARQIDTLPFFELDTQKMMEDQSKIVKNIVEALKIQKKSVHMILPDAFTYSQIVSMPRLNEKELLSAIKYQADQFIPMPIEETSLDLEILYENKSDNKLMVLIVASPKKVIEQMEHLAELSEVYAESIENELSAIGRFLSTFFIPPKPDGGTIFINIGYSATSLYYFDHSLRLLLDSHTFSAGYSLFLKETQVNTNVDRTKAVDILKHVGFSSNSSLDLEQILKPTLEALNLEITKFIASVKEKFKVNSISPAYLMNYATDILQIEKKIESSLAIPASIFNIEPIVKKNSVVDPFVKDLPSFVTTIGGCLA